MGEAGKRKPRVVVVLPAYNAARTLERTVAEIDRGVVDEIVLVDDHSADETMEVARRLGLRCERHARNLGYGGNQKTCYRIALGLDPDIVVMLHPDYQYDPRLIPAFVHFLGTGLCDVMLGSRIRSRREALEGGMPVWKYLSNRVLTITENIVLGQNLGDFHSGFRAFTREVLERLPLEANSDDFVFDTQMLAQCVYFGFRIGDAPMPVRYFREASSINFRRSLRYGFATLATLCSYLLARWGVRRSAVFREPPAP